MKGLVPGLEGSEGRGGTDTAKDFGPSELPSPLPGSSGCVDLCQTVKSPLPPFQAESLARGLLHDVSGDPSALEDLINLPQSHTAVSHPIPISESWPEDFHRGITECLPEPDQGEGFTSALPTTLPRGLSPPTP